MLFISSFISFLNCIIDKWQILQVKKICLSIYLSIYLSLNLCCIVLNILKRFLCFKSGKSGMKYVMVSSGHNSLDIQLYVKLKPLCINLWCKLINNYRKIIFFPKNRSGLHVVVICILLFLFKRDVCPNSTILFKILSDKKIAEDLSRFFFLKSVLFWQFPSLLFLKQIYHSY